MKNNNLIFTFFSLLMLVGLILTFQSCGDDEIEGCTDITADNYDATATLDSGNCVYSGCTDPDAENYNSQATNDDGSCVYARDKFIGMYLSVFTCPGFLAALSNDSLLIVIEPGLDENDKSSIILSLEVMGILISFRGSVDGETLTIMDELKDAVLPDLPTIGTITADVVGTGSATLSSDLSTIDGTVNLVVTAAGLPVPITGECTLVGMRQ